MKEYWLYVWRNTWGPLFLFSFYLLDKQNTFNILCIYVTHTEKFTVQQKTKTKKNKYKSNVS